MNEVMRQGLLITALGMGLVFVMIIALWGIMALLVRATQAAEPKAEAVGAEIAAEPDTLPGNADQHKQAAAVAVAYALHAARAQRSVATREETGGPSNWLIAGRSQQIQQSIKRGRER